MSDLEFELVGEIRNPPARARDGRYREVYEALDEAKGAAPEWVALAKSDKETIQKIRNAVARRVANEQAWHTQLHTDEDTNEVELFVKYDSKNPRKSRRPRKVPVAVAAAEDDDNSWLPSE